MASGPALTGHSVAGERWLDSLTDRAAAVLPAPVLAYLEAGAFEGTSTGEANDAWRQIRLLPRTLRDVRRIDTGVTLLGQRLASPIAVAPTAMQRAAHRDGEKAMAAGCAEAGALHVVSSHAGFAWADLALESPWWFQLYVTPDRAETDDAVHAAVAAGASAVVLTVDTPIPGPKPTVRDDDWADIDISWHRRNFPPNDEHWAADLSCADIVRLREITGLPVVVKGVLRADDALACVDAGAAAIWVSNHGGRQLDRAVPTPRALPDIAAAVRGRAEVYVDGGIRHGLDVLAGLAIGANAVFVGRPAFRALAVDGAAGVTRLLRDLTDELALAMRLGGVASVSDCGALTVSGAQTTSL